MCRIPNGNGAGVEAVEAAGSVTVRACVRTSAYCEDIVAGAGGASITGSITKGTGTADGGPALCDGGVDAGALGTGAARARASVADCASVRDAAACRFPDAWAARSSTGAGEPVRSRNRPKRPASCVRQSSRGFARGTLRGGLGSARATEGSLDAGSLPLDAVGLAAAFEREPSAVAFFGSIALGALAPAVGDAV